MEKVILLLLALMVVGAACNSGVCMSEGDVLGVEVPHG